MRCFIAIDMPKEIQVYLDGLAKSISGEKIKIVEKGKFHLTLGFLGTTKEFMVEKIKEALKDIDFEPFEAELGHVGFFPNESSVRVIFVYLEPRGKLKLLNQKIKDKLKPLGLKLGDFEAHITLARVKYIKNLEKIVEELKELKISPLKFKVDSFKLKRSFLTEKGPVYDDLEIFELF